MLYFTPDNFLQKKQALLHSEERSYSNDFHLAECNRFRLFCWREGASKGGARRAGCRRITVALCHHPWACQVLEVRREVTSDTQDELLERLMSRFSHTAVMILRMKFENF